MTDRHSGYVVVLERDMREDDAAATLAAIQQIKGVLTVEPVVASGMDQINHLRAKREMQDKIFEALDKL